MKRFSALLMALIYSLALFGCSRSNEEFNAPESTSMESKKPSGTYFFSGENEYLKLTDGSIVFGDTNEAFYGGNLEILQPDLFSDVCSYSTTFYTILNNGERNDFHSTTVTGVRNGADSINRDLGSSSSNGFMWIHPEQGLWFELITTDVDGNERVYLLELSVIEASSNPVG